MEDDDEFGDLYTDVLQPLQTTSSAPPIDNTIPSDDEEILFGSKSVTNSKPNQSDHNLNFNLNLSNKDEAAQNPDPEPRVLGSSSGFMKLEHKGIQKDPIFDHKDNKDFDKGEIFKEENFGIEEGGEEEEEDGFMIPGLSASGAPVSNSIEPGWDDSDSEDDLQIVLNDDNDMGMMGMEGGGGGLDEDEDDLVIVTDNADAGHIVRQPMEEMKDWGEDVGQAGEGGGERNELVSGDGGAAGAGAQKMGFGGHGYHPFHSQFKYVRPGAAPIPGAGPAAVGGAPGQVRPPGGPLPFAGRGRGEWRPPGVNKNVPPNMQKNFHSGYGMQGWGSNGAGRGFGSGLDFTLPSHKTIFEVDIDGFEEKPWRLQGVDVSDFFNFGMNEESWKEYCKQLDQHRLEATMQSKIRVYESGRTEQEYDPDLPPELAAAAGHDFSSENRNIVKINVQSDLAKGPAPARMQLPTGKAIQVETGFGERLPSIDTRPPRIRDSDAIIEIVLQRSPSPDPESVQGDDVDVVEHLEDGFSKENKKEVVEIEDEDGSEVDRFDKPQAYYNGRKREVSGRRAPFVGSAHDVAVTRDRVPHFSETEVDDHLDSRNRPVKRTASNRSPRLTDNLNEESTESVDRKQSHSSSPLTLGSGENRSFDQTDAAVKDDVVTDGNTNDDNTFKDEKLKHKVKKQKLITRAEHSSVERGDDREDSIHSIHIRKPMYETRGRDEYPHRKWESNQGYRSHPKPENYDRKRSKESEGVWHEDMMKRSHKARENERSDKNEHRSRKALENGGWKGDYDRDMNPVLKRNDSLKSQTRHHTIPEAHRESSSRRKRERDHDDSLQREKVERHRERDEWKEREREKDKSWVGHTRLKEDSRSSNKDYPFKETGREPVSRREKFENETVSRHRGRDDAYLQGNKISNDERIPSRHERGYGGSSKDTHVVQDKKHKETLKKGKETDGTIHNSLSTSRRNREDNNSQKSERASSRGNIEQRANDQNPGIRKSSKKHKEKENASSDDDEQQESKKGRSKLERWTSHKEKDFTLDVKETDIKYKDNGPSTKLPEESVKPQENLEKPKPLAEEKAEDAKPPEDKHLDTVEKLKKRSERFKLPMPSEKEALAVKKIENEPLISAQPETQPESEVKSERPARKRRWTSG
ncbi:FIP1[V]-like protein isoform X2 [Helianthus annuus]|uniref:Putative pre-mRNA polyadenylation factor Fip1 n=1 Tax=Helianthus annuus TaxID=4232 RepID=A0A251SZW7_HELAN|nr:FIP1[V]-like protein isoform X2 [Helianthus annuus]